MPKYSALRPLKIQKKHSDKPSSVVNAHLSSLVFANKFKRRVKTKTLTTPSCCGLGLQSRICCQNRWWALTPPFHLFRRPQSTSVRQFAFCCTFPQVALVICQMKSLSFAARTFLFIKKRAFAMLGGILANFGCGLVFVNFLQNCVNFCKNI